MSFIRNSIEAWRCAGQGVGFRSRFLAFACARLGNVSEKRRFTRAVLFKSISFFGRNGQVELSFSTSGSPLSIQLRKGNKADYLVFGEMVMGAYRLACHVSPRPSAVIDGGANIGLFSLFAHAAFPGVRFTCYEPDADNVVQLRKNLEANGIDAKVIPKALWSKTAELYFHPGESYSGFVDSEPSGYPISCVLPTVPDDCWLKLDIEGAEYEVLPALLEAGCQPRMISLEIHDFSRRGAKLLELLEAHGYQWGEPVKATDVCVNICAVTCD